MVRKKGVFVGTCQLPGVGFTVLDLGQPIIIHGVSAFSTGAINFQIDFDGASNDPSNFFRNRLEGRASANGISMDIPLGGIQVSQITITNTGGAFIGFFNFFFTYPSA